jgi:hypothetical protein
VGSTKFRFQKQHPTTLWCDNESAIKLAKDPVQLQGNKHIELHVHFIIELIHDCVLEVPFLNFMNKLRKLSIKWYG